MAIASFDKFIEPLLRLLEEQPDGIRTADAQQILVDQFGITPDERRELLPSGTYPVYKSRIGWAHDRLKRAGISSSVRHGFWRLTAEGLEYARKYKKLPAEELKRIAHPAKDSSVFDEEKPISTLLGNTEVAEDLSASSPDDRIKDALAEIQESLRHDLLADIWSRTPDFFERLVLQILKAMGYGADDRALDHSGSPGDDGIDGVISLDQLGLDKVYVQAKRYAEDRPISKEAIHGFIGALHDTY